MTERAIDWAEFLRQIRAARDELECRIVWYRGQSRAEYELIPSLIRHPKGLAAERAIFDEYEKSAARLHAQRSDDWQLLIDMQHYGIATRLLDWTDVLGIAVAFAMYDSHDDHNDSAIYVLNPLKLNEASGLSEIKRVPNDPQFAYKQIYWLGQPFKAVHPIAIDCAFQNDRIAAQNGTFTVHGNNRSPIEDQNLESVRKIILPAAVKPEARQFLEDANLNAFSIYPDIVGMARHIMRKHLDS